jgi:predicted  nucleic acid-binding Zn-ribbon protein
MTIEDTVEKLQTLAAKPTLTKAEHKAAQHLMRQLKEAGISNDQISTLSHEKWTPSTVKGYTPGIKAPSPSPWDTAVDVLDGVISAGITLDDVETAVNVIKTITAQGVDLKQVVELLLAIDSSPADLSAVVAFQQNLQEHDLVIKDVADALALKEQLNDQGMTLAALHPLAEIAAKHGDAQGALEAVMRFSSLAELSLEIEAAEAKLEHVSSQLSDANKAVSAASKKVEEFKVPLDAYHEAVELGFGQAELENLATLAGKYGGPKKVLGAVRAFTDLSDLVNKTEKAKGALASVEAQIQQLQIKHGHIQTSVTMCQTMIEQHKFGLDAISTVFSIAKKFGEPLSVLKGVEGYGNLQELGEELAQVQGKVAESEELLTQLEGKYRQGLDHLDSLTATALGVGEQIGKLESRLENSKGLSRILDLIDDPASADYGTYGPIVLVMGAAIRKWAEAHQHKFAFSYSIKDGLKHLVLALGES